MRRRIYHRDPEDVVPPASVSYFGSADDPQWQCQPQNAFQLYGDFQAWPIGCQKAFWFEMWPSSVELPAKKKKQNPEKVTEMFHEILHSGLTVSKAQAITTAALGSSKKKDDGEGKEDDGCKSSKDGRINCSVTIHDPGPDTSPIDDISAEHGEDNSLFGDPGGGGGGSGNGNGSSSNGVSPDCEAAVRNNLGDSLWEQAAAMMRQPPLIDIDALDGFRTESGWLLGDYGEMGINRFGTYAFFGETVGQTFDR